MIMRNWIAKRPWIVRLLVLTALMNVVMVFIATHNAPESLI